MQAQAAPLKGVAFVSYHKAWIYLANWLGMSEVANIEPKPGVPPGSAYIAELLDEIPSLKARMIVYAAYEDPKPSQFVAEKSASAGGDAALHCRRRRRVEGPLRLLSTTQ